MSNKNNWFYLIIFIIINLFFSGTVVTKDNYTNLLLDFYPFISTYIPILLLIILNITKKDKDLLKAYLITFAIIIIIPFILEILIGNIFTNASFVIKTICCIIINIYLFLNILKKEKNTNTEIQNNNNNNIEYESKKINYSFKYIILIIYNFIILFFTLTTDWEDWGAIIMGLIIAGLVFFGSPLLSFLLFKKHNKKGLIIFISLITSLLVFYSAKFFQNTDNIENLIKNRQEEKLIEQIISDKETNITIYNNNNYTIFLNYISKEINIVYEENTCGYNANNFIDLKCKLNTVQLNEINISNFEFNKNLLLTQNINNNIKMNIRFNEKDKNDLLFLINDKYYIAKLENQVENCFNEIINNNILQNKLLTISGKREYEFDKSPYIWYEIFSNDNYDYLIINDTNQSYSDGIEYYEYKYTKSYKCLRENKTDEERLIEYSNAYHDGYISKEINKTIKNVNNSYIEYVIIYDFGNMSWLEIVPKNNEYSIFVDIFNGPNIYNRAIK